MSKIARKLGRISVKLDQDKSDAVTSPLRERDESPMLRNHTVHVPFRASQHKSVSTSHLESNYCK